MLLTVHKLKEKVLNIIAETLPSALQLPLRFICDCLGVQVEVDPHVLLRKLVVRANNCQTLKEPRNYRVSILAVRSPAYNEAARNAECALDVTPRSLIQNFLLFSLLVSNVDQGSRFFLL